MTRTLHVKHVTTYSYDAPVPFALQQVRLTPRAHPGQKVLDWSIKVDGGKVETTYDDQHMNRVTLLSFMPDVTEIVVTSEGTVGLTENHGIVGPHQGCMPMWMYTRPTPLTKAGPACRSILSGVEGTGGTLEWLHNLSAAIRDTVQYTIGASDVSSTAEDVLLAGHGVCQDHAHVFIACCRNADVPARYVSGYLLMDDRVDQDATHAWAEVYLPQLGWVGFDISNGISPDQRYVRVATGLDYAEAAPISGTRSGSAGESLSVHVQVQQ